MSPYSSASQQQMHLILQLFSPFAFFPPSSIRILPFTLLQQSCQGDERRGEELIYDFVYLTKLGLPAGPEAHAIVWVELAAGQTWSKSALSVNNNSQQEQGVGMRSVYIRVRTEEAGEGGVRSFALSVCDRNTDSEGAQKNRANKWGGKERKGKEKEKRGGGGWVEASEKISPRKREKEKDWARGRREAGREEGGSAWCSVVKHELGKTALSLTL